MLSGHARVIIVDPEGKVEAVDFGPGDVWYFPRGYGHSLQGLADGAHFILAFDDGAFSEFGTFSLTDWLARTPPAVLTENLNLSADVLKTFPKEEVYIASGPVPSPLPLQPPPGTAAIAPLTHRYPLLAQRPDFVGPGGSVRIADNKVFPVTTTMAGTLEVVHPGGLRELHWHPHADEWQYYVSGLGRTTVFGSHGRARSFDFQAGDIGYVPGGYGHYIQNVGADDLVVMIVLNAMDYADVSLSDWMAKTPAPLLESIFGQPVGTFKNIPTDRVVIAK
jgi:oxalate decarboxylase